MKKKIHRAVKRFSREQLYVNSLFLILNSGILAVLGFLFWVINARLFTAEEVGLASTLISTASLFIAFSTLGFNISLIKYLPQSKDRNSLINSCFILSSLIMIVIAIVYLFFIDFLVPELAWLNDSLTYSIFFLFFLALAPMFNLSESVFIAERKSKYVFSKNLVWSIAKVSLPFFFLFGAFGIFSAWGVSVLLSLVVALVLMKFVPKVHINWKLLRKMMKFSAANYFANLTLMLPFMGLPIFVTILLGAEATGYFYIPWMIAITMFMVPQAVGKVLLSEGVREKKREVLKKAFKFNYVILVPAVIILLLIGEYLLLAFGANYVENSLVILPVLLMSSLIFAVHNIMSMYYNIEHKVERIVILNGVLALATFVFAYIFIAQGLEIVGVAMAWLIANGLTVMVLPFFQKKLV